MHSPREAAETSAMAGAEAAEPGHHGHRPHRRYFRSATQSKKDFAANQGMEWVKRCDKGSLEPVWRAVVARPAAAAGWSCSAEQLRDPSKGPILRAEGRRSAARGRWAAWPRLLPPARLACVPCRAHRFFSVPRVFFRVPWRQAARDRVDGNTKCRSDG